MTSEFVERRFEYATEGSDFSELLCCGVLEPLADNLAGERFKESGLGLVSTDQRWYFMDDTFVVAAFDAQKYRWDEDGVATVMYNPCLTFTRSRTEFEWWPDMEEILAEEQEEEQELQDEEDGPVLLSDDGQEEWTEDDEGLSIQDYCYVAEVWDYYLDDTDFKPHVNLRLEYYYKGEMIDVASQEGPAHQVMLSEDMDEDIDLQVRDGTMAQAFSEIDVALIEAICSFDFERIREALKKFGCWDEPDNDSG
jgi:hypothetical protein